MAYAKKTSGSSTKKTTSTHTQDNSAAKIAELESQLAQMKELLMAAIANKNTVAPVPTNSLNEEAKIIHLVERAPGLTTHIKLSNLAIDMSAFGEERTLDRRQAEELAGRYRGLFDEGIIAFGEGSEDLARRFGLKTYSDYKDVIGFDFVEKLGTINVIDLENLYNRLPQGLKGFIIEYFKRKIIEGDMRFNDPQKIEMLNRVSGCEAMSSVIIDRNRDANLASIKK